MAVTSFPAPLRPYCCVLQDDDILPVITGLSMITQKPEEKNKHSKTNRMVESGVGQNETRMEREPIHGSNSKIEPNGCRSDPLHTNHRKTEEAITAPTKSARYKMFRYGVYTAN